MLAKPELLLDGNILNESSFVAQTPMITEANNDQDLLVLSREGNIEAFGELAKRYEPRLFHLLLKLLRNASDAEDIAQETFLKAFRSMRQFKPGMPFAPWLFRIGTNLALDELRRRRPVARLEDIADEELLNDSRQLSSRSMLDQKQMKQLVEQELLKLPVEAAAAFDLRYGEEMSMAEIARIVGKPAGTIAVLIHRTRETLRRRIFRNQESTRHE